MGSVVFPVLAPAVAHAKSEIKTKGNKISATLRNACLRETASAREIISYPLRSARMSAAVSLGVFPTLTPAASSATFFASAVPDEPETIVSGGTEP